MLELGVQRRCVSGYYITFYLLELVLARLCNSVLARPRSDLRARRLENDRQVALSFPSYLSPCFLSRHLDRFVAL